MSVIGLRVGPFEIVEQARVPEEGRWYLARRTGMTRRQPAEVLVCLLPPDAPTEQRAALQRRFEALRAVDDARIAEPVAYYEGTGALAVGAARGVSLDRIIEGRRNGTMVMTPATLLDIVLEVAETLQHVHHKGKVHGHLSPDQILIGADGRVWVWGLSVGPGTPPDPAWCAPERARGEPPGEGTDQWSLAAVAAALISGRPPWQGDDLAVEAKRGEIGPLVEPVEQQWPALGRALRRMLDPRPANRYPSMHPVRQELLGLARKAGGTSDRRDIGALLATTHAPLDDDAAPARFEAAAPAGPAPAPAPEAEVEPEDAPVVSADARSEPPAAQPDASPADTPSRSVDPPDPPSDTGEPDIAMAVRASDDEPARRAAGRLPEEQIPVVRPEVRGEVPMAKLGSDRPAPHDVEGLASRPAPAPPPDAGDEPSIAPDLSDPGEADLEASEATMLFDASALDHEMGEALLRPDPPRGPPRDAPPPERKPVSAPTAAAPPRPPEGDPFDPAFLATPIYADRQRGTDDEDSEEHATVVFEASMLGNQLNAPGAAALSEEDDPASPTMVPPSDADEDDDDDDDDITLLHRDRGDEPGPSLGDVSGISDEAPLDEPVPSLAVRAAPLLVIVMLVLMLAWVFVRFV